MNVYTVFYILIIIIIFIILIYKKLINNYYINYPYYKNKGKIIFLTFGGGSIDYNNAAQRITRQAKSFNMFDCFLTYTENDLKNDKYFWNKHSDFILKNKRGYGYWIWKPYLIMKTLEKMKNDDILFYIDCGCELDIKYKNKMYYYFKNVDKDLIVGTLTSHNEKDYVKKDLLIFLDMYNKNILNSTQRQAGILLLKKTDSVYNLVKEWYKISCIYKYLDDSTSKNKNDNTFDGHRHDQAIFSLLTKKYNIFSNIYISEPVLISRNRTGVSKL